MSKKTTKHQHNYTRTSKETLKKCENSEEDAKESTINSSKGGTRGVLSSAKSLRSASTVREQVRTLHGNPSCLLATGPSSTPSLLTT